MKVSAHWAAVILITVPNLSGRASPSLQPLDGAVCLAVFPHSPLDAVTSQSAEGPPPLVTAQRKKIPSRSEYQSETSKKGRKRKRKTRSGGAERRSGRQTASKLSAVSFWSHAQRRWLSAPRKVWRRLSSHSWDYFGHLVSLRPAVNIDVCIFTPHTFFFFLQKYCFASPRWTDGVGFSPRPPPVGRILREMSERRRSAAALSSRAHAFSVEALIGSNKKRKLRGWEEKELELSMESLGTDGEDPAHCLDMDPGQCADTHHTAQMSGSQLWHCGATRTDQWRAKTWIHGSTTAVHAARSSAVSMWMLFSVNLLTRVAQCCTEKCCCSRYSRRVGLLRKYRWSSVRKMSKYATKSLKSHIFQPFARPRTKT